MTARIYHQPYAYTTSGPKLMGNNAAGESLLRGFLSYSRVNEFWAQVQKHEHAHHFAQTVQFFARGDSVKVADKNGPGALSQAGVEYYPGPGIAEHAFQRAAFGHGAWSLCGTPIPTAVPGRWTRWPSGNWR